MGETWKKYDPDHILEIPLKDALEFINEVIRIIKEMKKEAGENTEAFDMPPLRGENVKQISRSLPMKYTRALDFAITEDNRVDFVNASRQVLRFAVLEDLSDAKIKEIDMADHQCTE